MPLASNKWTFLPVETGDGLAPTEGTLGFFWEAASGFFTPFLSSPGASKDFLSHPSDPLS